MQEIEDPIQILVDLANRGEIDPWNIDIVAVTDAFLEKLREIGKLDLITSGRTLFYAAVLLRIKAETLAMENGEEEPGIDLSWLIPPVIREIVPRLRRDSKRPVTLDELVDALKRAEQVAKRREERRERRVEFEKILQAAAKSEELGKKVEKVKEILSREFSRRKFITFSELVMAVSNPTVRRETVAITYLSLLYIATREKMIRLVQEQMFGEIFIWKRDGGEENN